ncbi:YbaN family protein [Bacillus sp. SCS-151]|uniref:YbaN family protein n=1 Tax=Nanhaiella sioensis TaxID=3115293 RepID=UPI00397BC11F
MKTLQKTVLIVIGTVALVCGVIGIILPLIPTTPFLLLAGFCYAKSSRKLYDRLMNNKILGEYIKNYREHKAIPMKPKIIGVLIIWSSVFYTFFFLSAIIYLKVIFFIGAVVITYLILSIKTLKRDITA